MLRRSTAALLAAALLAPSTARADIVQDECVEGYEAGQRSRADGKLRAARRQFALCARPQCPKITQTDCAKWVDEVDARMPTVLLRARDPAGQDVEQARVYLDGELIAERLDGRPLAVDPGAHTLKFETEGKSAEQRVVLLEGEKDRRIVADLAPTGGPPPPPPVEPAKQTGSGSGRSIPTASWVLGGVSIVALGLFVGFAASGKSTEGCVPRCTSADIDAFRRDYAIADVSLVVSLVAAGAAVWIALANKPKTATGIEPGSWLLGGPALRPY
jgi:hypothetical protein